MWDFLHHLFFPRGSNNHRSKLLHHSSLLSAAVALLALQLLLVSIKNNFSNVLGTTTDISSQVLLQITNKDRQQYGVADLKYNDQLSKAAQMKAEDMFAKNYWAHNSPDGLTPWIFFKRVGYVYVYAGENLARGFSTSSDVINAWMASPSHRENMLSPNYQDVGFAVEDGKLLGENTTLIVEEFGNLTTSVGKSQSAEPSSIPNPNVRSAEAQSPQAVKNSPLIDSSSLAWNISFFVLSLFIIVLLLDMIFVERKRVVRFVGHNIDHILYLCALLIFILAFSKGVV
jgi:uncharacterized protein YkwD